MVMLQDKKSPDDNGCSKEDSDRNLAKESEISDVSWYFICYTLVVYINFVFFDFVFI